MKKFKELGIKAPEDGLIGDKISVNKVLNRNIIIQKFKISDSKYKWKRLDLQIEFDKEKRVMFISSKTLIKMIEQVQAEDFPFETVIVRENNRLEFS